MDDLHSINLQDYVAIRRINPTMEPNMFFSMLMGAMAEAASSHRSSDGDDGSGPGGSGGGRRGGGGAGGRKKEDEPEDAVTCPYVVGSIRLGFVMYLCA